MSPERKNGKPRPSRMSKTFEPTALETAYHTNNKKNKCLLCFVCVCASHQSKFVAFFLSFVLCTMSPFPSNATITDASASGTDVPAARTVTPIISEDTPTQTPILFLHTHTHTKILRKIFWVTSFFSFLPSKQKWKERKLQSCLCSYFCFFS